MKTETALSSLLVPKFYDETRSFARLLWFLKRTLWMLESPAVLIPGFWVRTHWEFMERSLVSFGGVAGFCDPDVMQRLFVHQRRIERRSRITLVALITPVFPLLVAYGFLVSQASHYLLFSFNYNLSQRLLALFAIFVLWIVYIISSLVVPRFVSALTIRYFAESLSVHNVLLLVIEIQRENVLSHPDRKYRLVQLLRGLRKTIEIIPFRYLSSPAETTRWVHEHFARIADFITERENWVIVPSYNTLTDLRHDVHYLANLVIRGTYGQFEWSGSSRVSPAQTWRTHIGRDALKVTGFLLPLLFMGYGLVYPPHLASGQLPGNAIIVLFIAWFLLAIDSLFNLGVIANVVSLAKGIKELK